MYKTMVDLDKARKIHFIGIAGAGMRAIANIFVEKGYIVSGSDIKASAVTDKFIRQGVRICIGQRSENLEDAEVVVISSAIRESNVEVVEARRRHIPVIHRSDALVHIMSWGKGISVAGAHGKTTTTSMLGQVFQECGMKPTLVIGGEVDYLHSNSVLGTGPYVIAEADESDGTFLKQRPDIAVVTNIDADHMDHYGSMEHVMEAFKEFIHKLNPETGLAVLCAENENIRRIIPYLQRRFMTYGIDQAADYQAKNLHYDGGKLRFDVWHKHCRLGEAVLNVPGRHNALNALAAIAVSLHCGLSFSRITGALSRFHGAKRRFQTKGVAGGVWIVDDYAHHPTEINATLTAARDMGTHRVICLFQPHRYTRTQLLLDEYGTAFTKADLLIVTDVYSAGEDPIPGVSGGLIAEKVRQMTGQEVLYIPEIDDIVTYLQKNARPLDLVITMGAGDIYIAGERYLMAVKGQG